MKLQYQIIDRDTKSVVATCVSAKRAHTKKDKLDNAYGSYHYSIKMVEVTE